jgi:uncharacterized membrane protein
MLVAPLMTPILAIAAAVVQDWGKRVVESFAIVGAGALAAIAVGVAIAFITPALRTDLPLPSEMLARTNPNLIDLAIAIAAGLAGASAVGVGTALFYDPLAAKKINAGIAAYLKEHGLASVGELVGGLQTD